MSEDISDLVELLSKENARLVLEITSTARDRAAWSVQLEQMQAAVERSSSSASSLETEISQLKAQIADLRKQLRIVHDEREYYKTQAEGNSGPGGGRSASGGGGDSAEWAETVQALRDENEDLRHEAVTAHREVELLKKKIAEVEKSAAAVPKFQDPQPVNGNSNTASSSNSNSSNNEKQLLKQLEELRAASAEIGKQRDLFSEREERALAREARASSEIQGWAQLLKKLLASLKSVRGCWDTEVEHNDQSVTRIVTESLDPEKAYHIVESLNRVMTGIKRGSITGQQPLVAGSSPASAGSSGADLDCFTSQMRPTLVEMLKLLHGVVSDSAVLYANMTAAKHKQQEDTSAATSSGKGTKGQSSWSLFGSSKAG